MITKNSIAAPSLRELQLYHTLVQLSSCIFVHLTFSWPAPKGFSLEKLS